MKQFTIQDSIHIIPQFTLLALKSQFTSETIMVKVTAVFVESLKCFRYNMQLQTDYIPEHKIREQEIFACVRAAIENCEIGIPCHICIDQSRSGGQCTEIDWFDFCPPSYTTTPSKQKVIRLTPAQSEKEQVRQFYNTLIESQFDFLKKPMLLHEIYAAVSSRWPEHCNNDYLCCQNCKSGGSDPEWKHRVRTAISAMKRKDALGQDAEKRYYRK